MSIKEQINPIEEFLKESTSHLFNIGRSMWWDDDKNVWVVYDRDSHRQKYSGDNLTEALRILKGGD